MSSAKKILLVAAAIMITVAAAYMAATQGVPTGKEIAAELVSRDPLLSWISPDTGAKPEIHTDPGYEINDLPALYDRERAGETAVFLIEVYGDDGLSLASFEDPATAAGARLPVIIREGTSGGAVKWEGLGDSAAAPNATIEIRGEPDLNRVYHSFKIRLEAAAGQYGGQSILNFKKAYGKPLRVEEKFAFDLFSALPNTLSMRTKFARLYIRDNTAPNPGYADYGLYTMVEQPDEYYFTTRSLDGAGSMYQAEDFDFSPHPELKNVSDPGYDKDAFELVLDIKQGDSHKALLEMLSSVNDPDADIDAVVDAYFDRENLLNWLAMNALLANGGCVNSGYCIYKPRLSSKWFFVPSNMGEAMPAGRDDRMAEVMVTGRSMFCGNVLYERFLSKPENLSALTGRMEQLMTVFDADFISSLTDRYIPAVAEYFKRNPDRGMLSESPEYLLERIAGYRENLRLNADTFYANLKNPGRVELLPVKRPGGGRVELGWRPSLQIGGGAVSYRVEAAADTGFGDIIAAGEGLTETRLELEGLPGARLYWRVTAIDQNGLESGCTAVTELESGELLYGAGTFVLF